MSGLLLAPPFEATLFRTLLALNNAHAAELSYKTADDFRALLDAASHVRADRHGLAFLVAFDDSCIYDNPNFAWFKGAIRAFTTLTVWSWLRRHGAGAGASAL